MIIKVRLAAASDLAFSDARILSPKPLVIVLLIVLVRGLYRGVKKVLFGAVWWVGRIARKIARRARARWHALLRYYGFIARKIHRAAEQTSSMAMTNLLDFWSARFATRDALDELLRRIHNRKPTAHVLINTIMIALRVPDVRAARQMTELLFSQYPNSYGLQQQVGIQFFLAGHYKDAERIWSRAEDLRERALSARGLDRLNMRLLGPSWLLAIGHIAHIDIYLKHKLLSGQSAQKTVLVPPRGFPIPNRVLLECWRPYVEIWDADAALPLELCDLEAIELVQDEFWCIKLNAVEQTRMFSYAASHVQHEWDKTGRPPLLSVEPELEQLGWSVLEQLGVPRNAWFVCLHVREAGFHKAWHEKHPGTRNADVLTYMDAVRTIVERGGWVIRMGDASMAPLPQTHGLIDYAHSEVKSAAVDVFLCAKARFFIGTNSGLGLVPPIFGVPCVLTNWSPIALPQWYTRDRFIPKMVYSTGEKRLLTIEELFTTPAGWQQFEKYFREHDLQVLDNTPEEINQLIMEMLDETDRRETLTAYDDSLVVAYNRLVLHHGGYVGARPGRDFLRRHANELASYLEHGAARPVIHASTTARHESSTVPRSLGAL
jgi:putative glycosyltransferase (TIGR04372 family)